MEKTKTQSKEESKESKHKAYLKEYRLQNKDRIKEYYLQTADCDICGRKNLGLYYLEKHKMTKYCQKARKLHVSDD
jgi:hypothetical protein